MASNIALGTQHPASREGKDMEGTPQEVPTVVYEARSRRRRVMETTTYNIQGGSAEEGPNTQEHREVAGVSESCHTSLKSFKNFLPLLG